MLLFDLDETLIHVRRQGLNDPDEAFSEESFECDYDIPIIDPDTNTVVNASFSVRPFVNQCLELANKYFEVGIFTAGKDWFADPILNKLDPDGKYF